MSPGSRWRQATLLGLLGLIALHLAWPTLIDPAPPAAVVGWLLLGAGPLVACLRGVLDRRPVTHACAALLACLYASHAALLLHLGEPPLWPALLELPLASALLVGSAFYARVRARALRAEHAVEPGGDEAGAGSPSHGH